MKKTLLLIFLSFWFITQNASAQNIVNAYVFYGEGCPHCAKERTLLSSIQEKYADNVKVYEYEVYNNPNNIKLLKDVAQKLNISVDGVPFLIIGDRDYVGFSDSTSPAIITDRIEYCIDHGCNDKIDSILGIQTKNSNEQNVNESIEESDDFFTIPVIGNINAKTISLPLITIIMGVLDGFNPCAMWTLLFLISLLIGIENRKRMWMLGTIFIVSSATVYFLFMSAWLNLMFFIGFITWIRIAIGILAIGAGIYSIRDFFVHKEATCKITGDEKRRTVFEKLKTITKEKSLLIAGGGIAILAIAVNMVELVCSAGLPAIYTQILSLNSLGIWQYYMYIAIYILFFMLDDLFVFFVSMITLEMTGITTKYARYSRIVGGVLMTIIGILLIFKYEILMF